MGASRAWGGKGGPAVPPTWGGKGGTIVPPKRFAPYLIIFLKILLCHLQSLEMVLLEKQHKF
jgi:hypothetical protein